MRLWIKRISQAGLWTGVVFALAWLMLVIFTRAEGWKTMWYESRHVLLLWRLGLYALLIWIGVMLNAQLKQHYPAYTSSLRRIAGWSAVFIVLCELSNSLLLIRGQP